MVISGEEGIGQKYRGQAASLSKPGGRGANCDCQGSYKMTRKAVTPCLTVCFMGAWQSGCLLTAVPLHFYSCHWGTAAGVSAALIFHVHQGNYQTNHPKRTTESSESSNKIAGFRNFFFRGRVGGHDTICRESSLWLRNWITCRKHTQNRRTWSGSVQDLLLLKYSTSIST